MAIKLRDIADRLKLSPSLVSGVLNNREGVWASDETRRRVIQVAQDMGYRPNAAARALRSGCTRTVALVYLYPEFHPDYPGAPLPPNYEGVPQMMADYLGTHDYRLMVKVFNRQDQVLSDLEESCRSRICDAFVLWGEEPEVSQQGSLLDKYHFPFIVKGRHELEHPNWPQIDFDHEKLMSGAVDELVARGHHKLCYIGFSPEQTFTDHLRNGYLAAMERNGLPIIPELISTRGQKIDSSQRQIADWLQLDEEIRPTALVIGASEYAWHGTELALARVGRKLGWGQNDFAAAGIGRKEMKLLFGEASMYRQIELYDLVLKMGELLLLPLLEKKDPSDLVVRILPPMEPTIGWKLLDYVRFQSTS